MTSGLVAQSLHYFGHRSYGSSDIPACTRQWIGLGEVPCHWECLTSKSSSESIHARFPNRKRAISARCFAEPKSKVCSDRVGVSGCARASFSEADAVISHASGYCVDNDSLPRLTDKIAKSHKRH